MKIRPASRHGSSGMGEVPKTGSPLLSETTIPVYPFVSSFLHDSSKSFSIRDPVALLSVTKMHRRDAFCAQMGKDDTIAYIICWGCSVKAAKRASARAAEGPVCRALHSGFYALVRYY